MHITLEKTEVFDMLDTPMLKLDSLRKSMAGQVVQLVDTFKPTPWWDLLGRMRGDNSMAVALAAMGTSSVQQVESLYEHLAAMRSLAELSSGPVHVTHKDLLHVAGARKLCAAVDAAKWGRAK